MVDPNKEWTVLTVEALLTCVDDDDDDESEFV